MNVNVIWLAIGIVFMSFTIIYFRLARKSSQQVSLKDIKIDKLDEEVFTPPQGVGQQTITTIGPDGQISSETRSQSLKSIASQHLNRNIFPKVKEHLNEIYRTGKQGFLIAGIVSVISMVLAFLSAFQVL